MERLAVLLLVSLALAGCTAPPESPNPTGSKDPGSGPATVLRGVPEIRPLEPQAEESNADPAAPGGNGTSDHANRSAVEPPPPGSNATLGAGNASEALDATPAAPAEEAAAAHQNGSKPQAETDPGPAPPAVPRPVLRPGDRWLYRGANLSGGHYEELLEVVGTASVAGVPSYLLNATVRGENRTLHLTREGLNPVNGTGFVTSLLRFPLEVGANWSFHWEQADRFTPEGTRDPLTVRQSVHGEMRVLGAGNMTTIGGRWPALHLEANITSSLGTLTKVLRVEYWYAPGVKAIVRTDTYYEDGRHAWSELVQARLAPAVSN